MRGPTGNGLAVTRSEVLAGLQDQGHGAAGVGLPVQRGGLPGHEGVAPFGNGEGVPAVLGGGHSHQGAKREGNEGAHGIYYLERM